MHGQDNSRGMPTVRAQEFESLVASLHIDVYSYMWKKFPTCEDGDPQVGIHPQVQASFGLAERLIKYGLIVNQNL
jgi:hypothetical protein